jgi:hypothetical protein
LGKRRRRRRLEEERGFATEAQRTLRKTGSTKEESRNRKRSEVNRSAFVFASSEFGWD